VLAEGHTVPPARSTADGHPPWSATINSDSR
jgi:hypothetical protein